ncbi:hypothetical protein Kisp01_06590 [Kineosporia sp. NBRC 101677]|uniref:hypothetical protein n=1 Tax=Kineosporia sp. NBRC 101677 TaxID=3032197 RepID=UPI0024A19321|nr:hypothetical protein [Kineosporia sp. NBRC 101677]GLY13643.1 hypothetical protein Kisp01_06590 [Kineosporia sp. NBRC 101677]
MRTTLLGLLAIVSVLLGIAGVVLLFFPYEFSFYGPILIGIAVVGFTLAIFGEDLNDAIPAVVCVVGLALVVASLGALAMRTITADSYRYHYGDKVTVAGACPPEEQPERIVIRRRGGGGQATETCPASWTLAGRQIEGEVKLPYQQLSGFGDQKFSIVAYAIGDKASSDQLDDLDPEYGVMRYAGIPLRTAGGGALVVVLGLSMGMVLGRLRTRRQLRALQV